MDRQLHLDKNGRYLVGVSGGSDSMALLALCVQQGYEVIAAHVNYRLRANAEKEEEIVRAFCGENDVKLHVIHAPKPEAGNFQNWAREYRYEFYKRMYDREECTALLLGHQLDDSIENYLMAKERGSQGEYFGMVYASEHHGMKVIRPLLAWRKRETRQFCLDNSIPFGDDESNFSDKYTRNRIRHHLVEPADDQQISRWAREIREKNEAIDRRKEYLKRYFPGNILLSEYRQEPEENRLQLLRDLISRHTGDSPSSEFIRETDRQLGEGNGPLTVKLADNVSLYREYGHFYVCRTDVAFNNTYDTVRFGQTRWYTIAHRGKTIEGVTLHEDDFPITIRSPLPEDEIELRIGHKKINRFFIDRKIEHRERLTWPVVVNYAGDVIFVTGIGCDVRHYSVKPTMFVIK